MTELACRSENICLIASDWGGDRVETSDAACAACVRSGTFGQKNGVTASLVFTHMNKNGRKIPDEFLTELKGYFTNADYPEEGPGTELKKLMSWFNLKDSQGCKCKQRAIQMNAWGPDKCEENMELILEWLREAAKQENVFYSRAAAYVLVKTAITTSRLKNGSNNRNADA